LQTSEHVTEFTSGILVADTERS